MYGEHCAHARKRGIQLRLGLEKGNGESRLPVMRVKDMWRAQMSQRLENRSREENEPFRVIRVVSFGRAVQEWPVEITVRANEMDWDAEFCLGRQQSGFLGPAADRDIEAD